MKTISAQPIYLICGVSGSGKTWVCKRLEDKFVYVPHDEHYHDQDSVLEKKAIEADKPLITESPFGERILKEKLERRGLKVIPYFVVTAPHTVAIQYFQREGKPLPKAAYTRASRIVDRAKEWKAFYGSSKEVLQELMKYGASRG